MVAIEDKTIHITRGDITTGKFNRLAFYLPIYNAATQKEEKYEFQLDDKICFVIFTKKGYTKQEILRKEYTPRKIGYTEPTTVLEIPLTEEDTKKLPLLNKKATYWYDISLNETLTVLGYDNEGAKKVIGYPEGGKN